jgi:hypothetical protein
MERTRLKIIYNFPVIQKVNLFENKFIPFIDENLDIFHLENQIRVC